MQPRTSNHLKLFGGNFCEQPLVLGKLLKIVKWSTFCVSFIRVLTIPRWLYCFEILKIDYLVTPYERFGTVSITPVTNCFRSWHTLKFILVSNLISIQMKLTELYMSFHKKDTNIYKQLKIGKWTA